MRILNSKKSDKPQLSSYFVFSIRENMFIYLFFFKWVGGYVEFNKEILF